jgi:hypothetical protein
LAEAGERGEAVVGGVEEDVVAELVFIIVMSSVLSSGRLTIVYIRSLCPREAQTLLVLSPR